MLKRETELGEMTDREKDLWVSVYAALAGTNAARFEADSKACASFADSAVAHFRKRAGKC